MVNIGKLLIETIAKLVMAELLGSCCGDYWKLLMVTIGKLLLVTIGKVTEGDRWEVPEGELIEIFGSY